MLRCALIVDDDNVSNFLAEKVIRNSGQVNMVSVVTDGRQALNYIKFQCDEEDPYACPDLILLDLNMPYFDGFEFLEGYKKKGVPPIPVVAVTATEPQAVQKEKLKRADIPYIIKPLTSAKFESILNQLHLAQHE